MTSFLAHQGGWDEMLMVAVPIALFALVLRMASRRAVRRVAEADAQSTATTSAPNDDNRPAKS